MDGRRGTGGYSKFRPSSTSRFRILVSAVGLVESPKVIGAAVLKMPGVGIEPRPALPDGEASSVAGLSSFLIGDCEGLAINASSLPCPMGRRPCYMSKVLSISV